MLVAVLALTTVGCQKQIDLTFYNHTDAVLPVQVTTPEVGTMDAGSIGANGSMLNYTIRLETSNLPADCSVAVGRAARSFTVTEDTREHLWFHYTDQGLAGPMDRDAGVTVIKQEGEVTVPAGTRMIVE